jgi:adenylate cyclase
MIDRMEPGERNQGPEAAEAQALSLELGAPPELEEAIGMLLKLGVSAQAIKEAYARGSIEDAIFEPVLDPAREERTVSPREIEGQGGLSTAETQVMTLNFGLRAPEPDEPYFTPEEGRALMRIGELREIWPPDVYLRVARVYGQALARVAEIEMEAFRHDVVPQLRAASGGSLPALPAIHEAFGQLLPLADPLILGVHRRRIELETAQAAVREAERHSASGVLPGAVDVTLAFCDLKDFTAYAEARGDAVALTAIEQFATAVAGELGEHGYVVKALGDGYMLSFPNPGEAVRACVRTIERMHRHRTLGVHASVHHGVALYRDGDYFGRTVNLAARLLGLAGNDELVASEAVVLATRGEFDWQPGGLQRLRGVGEPVEISRLSIARREHGATPEG